MELQKLEQGNTIKDDPHIGIPFKYGVLGFAGYGKDSRDNQVFISLADNTKNLGKANWETPFGIIIKGINAIELINTEYDDDIDQGRIFTEGYKYLKDNYPRITYMDYCRVLNDIQTKQFYKNYYVNLDQQPLCLNK